jgi:hypothetical protein
VRAFDEAFLAQALPGWSGAAGTVATRFVIGPDGLVQGVRILSNDTGIHELGCCMASVLSALRFHEPAGGFVIVQWPFVFRIR